MKPVYLVRGEDAALVGQATRDLLEQLVGPRDPALVVEEHGGPTADGLDVGSIIDACATPPFLIDRRVVVVRDAGRLSATDSARLVALLEDPLPTTALVLVGGGGTVPAALVRAVGAVGEVLESTVRTGKDRDRWLQDHLAQAPVRLSAAAGQRLGKHLGEDLGRLDGLLRTLAAAYGEAARVGEEELEPFLGEAGAVPPWDLTDAIDAGAAERALEALHRMTGAGGRSSPEVLAILHRHFGAMLRLDGAEVTGAEEAARLLGVKSSFVAKKALAQSRRLGSQRVAQAIVWLSEADLDVKGQSALPPEVVLEILVGRLSRLVRARQPSARR